MVPWVHHGHDIGFTFTVKCGSSTIRHWGSANGFEPTPPHAASRLIGIVRNPVDRFYSMVQQYMKVYAKNNFDEDPEVFDRVWPGLAQSLNKGKTGQAWHNINPHFVKQHDHFVSFPATEYWKLDNFDEYIQPIIEQYGFAQPTRRKIGDAGILNRIKNSTTDTMLQTVWALYREDYALYAKAT